MNIIFVHSYCLLGFEALEMLELLEMLEMLEILEYFSLDEPIFKQHE